jgi:hypothetical protein
MGFQKINMGSRSEKVHFLFTRLSQDSFTSVGNQKNEKKNSDFAFDFYVNFHFFDMFGENISILMLCYFKRNTFL